MRYLAVLALAAATLMTASTAAAQDVGCEAVSGIDPPRTGFGIATGLELREVTLDDGTVITFDPPLVGRYDPPPGLFIEGFTKCLISAPTPTPPETPPPSPPPTPSATPTVTPSQPTPTASPTPTPPGQPSPTPTTPPSTPTPTPPPSPTPTPGEQPSPSPTPTPPQPSPSTPPMSPPMQPPEHPPTGATTDLIVIGGAALLAAGVMIRQTVKR